MGDHPEDFLLDPNTGDDMVDKDDLFQEEDGMDPQDHGGDEPTPDEDDDIFELLDVVETPDDAVEEEVIDLLEIAGETDDNVIELAEETEASDADDGILELTEVAAEDETEQEDDILELTDIADTAAEEREEILELTQEAEASDADDAILELTEVVAEDETEQEDDFLELTDIVDTAAEAREEVPDFTEAAEASDVDEEILELTDAVTEDETEQEDDILELTDIADTAAEERVEIPELTQEAEASIVDDEILDLTETATEEVTEEEITDLTEPFEPSEPDQEERFADTVALPSVGYEEDKELLELIDDIQATLNDEPVAADTGYRKETAKDVESYTFLDDDELITDKDVTESETEFVDHLGIDLTSEIERKALREMQEAAMEEVRPTESLESTMAQDSLEKAVKQALTDMLADENNPLAKAIENAVKTALGQGRDT
jgi:hypothetical protein